MMSNSKHWLDNADSYICPVCGLEVSSPAKYEGCKCPKCGFQDEKDKKVDNVNHPQHYEGATSIECIEAMELIFGTEKTANWCSQTAFKYIWRYKHKNGEEDVNKAGWYIDWIDKKLEDGCDFGNEFLETHNLIKDLYYKALKYYKK